MSNFYVDHATSLDQQQVDLFLQDVVFKDYDHYRSFKREIALEYLRGIVKETMSAVGSYLCYARENGNQPVGLATVEPLSWESSFFGLQMARVNLLLSRCSAEPYPVASKLLDFALAGAREAGLEHLSVRLGVDDIGLLHAFEDNGFRLMDTLCTYICEPHQELPSIKESAFTIRSYRPDDYPEVQNIASQAFRGYPNRFSMDPHISDEQAGKFYLEWTNKFCRNHERQYLLVAEKKGRVIGFLGGQKDEKIYHLTGKQVAGRGLGACYPIRFNGYYYLLHELARRYRQAGDISEFDTQSFNIATMNFYQRLGLRYVRAKYTLHCFIG